MASPLEEKSYGTLEPIGGGDAIPLVKERMVIGRRETCDICLQFANISSRHCELILDQGYWRVRDLQSTNGVKVNGERVQEKRVYPGDELTIAKHRFRLNYVPTTALSADAEVEELHEDYMRVSLLERAGLAKRRDEENPARRPGRAKPAEPEEAAALDYLNAPPPRPESARPAAPAAKNAEPPPKPVAPPPPIEETIEPIVHPDSLHDLDDEAYLKLFLEDQNKQPPQNRPQRSR